MIQNDLKNYYEVLEIPHNAKAEEIYYSYQRAKAAYSNDSLALYSLISAEECRNILNLVDEAYTILSDPSKRKMYDEARGFNQQNTIDYSPNLFYQGTKDNFIKSPSLNSFPKVETPKAPTGESTIPSSSMNKLVAQQRFSLDYVVNEDFEKEIEATTDFSGEFLQKIREYKNITIERLADMTKVSPMNLRYIESESFSKLPAPVYVRGFVFQYAKCLKLKPEVVANSFVARMKQK